MDELGLSAHKLILVQTLINRLKLTLKHKKMKNKKRIIPKTSKEQRHTAEIGYHNLPNWVLIIFGVTVFLGIVGWLFR